MDLKQMYEQRASLHSQMTAILDKAKAENRAMTAEDNEKFDKIDVDIVALTKDIERQEKAAAHSVTMNASRQPQMEDINGGAAGKPQSEEQAKRYAQTYDRWMRVGDTHLSADERALLAAGSGGPQAALSPATGSTGQYLIPTGFSDKLEEARKWYGGMVQVAETITTGTGNPIPWPSSNDTVNVGEIIGPNTQVTQAYPSFGNIIFNAYKFSSKAVLVPLELLQDSFFDLDSKIPGWLGERIARIENTKFTVGTGINEPTGIVTAAVAAGLVTQLPTGNTTGIGSTSSVAYDNLVNLETSVDKAYRQGAKYMFHDQTLSVIKKLKDNNGRPLWLPGLGNALAGGFPSTVNGYEYVINNDMPVPGAGNYIMTFGMLTAFKIRRVSGYWAMRLTERYADYWQVGFQAAERADSNLVDAGTHPIALLQNSAT